MGKMSKSLYDLLAHLLEHTGTELSLAHNMYRTIIRLKAVRLLFNKRTYYKGKELSKWIDGCIVAFTEPGMFR